MSIGAQLVAKQKSYQDQQAQNKIEIADYFKTLLDKPVKRLASQLSSEYETILVGLAERAVNEYHELHHRISDNDAILQISLLKLAASDMPEVLQSYDANWQASLARNAVIMLITEQYPKMAEFLIDNLRIDNIKGMLTVDIWTKPIALLTNDGRPALKMLANLEDRIGIRLAYYTNFEEYVLNNIDVKNLYVDIAED